MRALINKIIEWRPKKIIGLDIDDGCVVATWLIRKGKEIYLDRFAFMSNLKEVTKDPNLEGAGVMINLPAQLVLFRSFHLASSFLNSKNKQRDITAFLSKQNLPFTLEECFWDTFILNSNLNFIAARKDVVEKYIAQVKDLGLHVIGVTPPLVALYNVLIYTYPEREKGRFALLNIRNSSSELLIYESKRLWVYPLSIGKRDLVDVQTNSDRFSIEVQRIFNAHYLQNPPLAQKTVSYFYLSGQECQAAVKSCLKKVLGDFEITVLQPLKRIDAANIQIPANQQMINLSLGLGLTYLEAPKTVKINLIAAKIKQAHSLVRINLFKKISLFFVAFVALCFLLWNIALIKSLKNQTSIYKNTTYQVSSVLPQVVTLKEEKEKLQKLEDFLENKLTQQGLYLKALAVISEGKPASITIKELELQIKDTSLQVFLSGDAPTYQEINDFLSGLKKNKDIKNVKVVASAFSAPENQQGKGIDFKLHFELPAAAGENKQPNVVITEGKEVTSSSRKNDVAR